MFLTVGAFVSLILGTLPKGGRLFSLAGLAYGVAMAWPTVQIVRRRGNPAHLLVLALMVVPTNWVDAWMIDRPAPRWTSALIPLCIAGGATFDLVWRRYRRVHPKPIINQLPPTPALMSPVHSSHGRGTLEALREELRTHRSGPVSIWVPHTLTFGGTPVADQPDGLAEALLQDTALDAGLLPDGHTAGQEGTTFHYRHPQPVEHQQGHLT